MKTSTPQSAPTPNAYSVPSRHAPPASPAPPAPAPPVPPVPPASAPHAGAPSELESRRVAEAARETQWTAPSFLRELFLGNFRFDLIHPNPAEGGEERPAFREFCVRLRAFLRDHVDPVAIDAGEDYPPAMVDGLRR